jgi:hypothetical protein
MKIIIKLSEYIKNLFSYFKSAETNLTEYLLDLYSIHLTWLSPNVIYLFYTL